MPTYHREYRIVLPFTTAKYNIAQLYTVSKMSLDVSVGDTSVLVLENKPHSHEIFGDCRYTEKIYNLGSKAPSLIRAFVPSKALKLTETAYNAFPRCHTQYKNHYFSETTFRITIDSFHCDGGEFKENVMSIDENIYKNTQFQILNICDDIVEKEYNPKNLVSKNIPQLGQNWVSEFKERNLPLMVCYKFVTIEIHSTCLNWTHSHIEKSIKKLLLKTHQQMACEIDSWFHLSIDDIRKMEDETKDALEKKELKE